MMELWHDVGGCGWYGVEEEIARRGGAVGGGAPAVPTRTWCALGLTFAQGVLGVR